MRVECASVYYFNCSFNLSQPPSGVSFRSSCQNSSSSVKTTWQCCQRGSEYIGRFFGTFYCFRASCCVLLLFFFILYPICPTRGRGLSSVRALLLFVCSYASRFPTEYFRFAKLQIRCWNIVATGERAWHAISCVLNEIKVSFKGRARYFLSATLLFSLCMYL